MLQINRELFSGTFLFEFVFSRSEACFWFLSDFAPSRIPIDPPTMGIFAGLSPAFFSVLNAPFFFVLLKNATLFSVLFSSFWQLMRPKRTLRSFLKNVKERRERNVLL